MGWTSDSDVHASSLSVQARVSRRKLNFAHGLWALLWFASLLTATSVHKGGALAYLFLCTSLACIPVAVYEIRLVREIREWELETGESGLLRSWFSLIFISLLEIAAALLLVGVAIWILVDP